MTDFYPAELARLADNATPCDWVAAESQGLAWQVFAQSVWGPFIVRDVERQRDAQFIAYCGTHRDAIVAALQPRTVTTVTELDALPDDTVIRSRLGEVFIVDENRWLGQDGTDDTKTEHIDLPATVLWIPGS